MKHAVVLVALLISSSAFAQQPQIKTPSQVAVDIVEQVGLLARYAEQQQTLVQQLQAENVELKKKLEGKETVPNPATGAPKVDHP